MSPNPKILVASKNPVKISAAQTGFATFFPDWSPMFEGISVPSGVAVQPMSDAETLRGAANRVTNLREGRPAADFWIGIEGGIDLQADGGSMLAMAWIVIESAGGRQGRARTGAFVLPQAVAELVRAGHELGEADDIVFGGRNTKQNEGAVGLLTGGIIDRAGLYAHGVMLALIPFLNPTFY